MAKINDLPLLSNPTEDMYCLVGKEDLQKVPWSAIMGQIGAPYIATTVAGMTDKTRVYVYQGSESGYTSGNWYYWNGSAWTSGGTYNSAAVNTDKTLTQSDKPADSAIVGKEIGSLKESLGDIESKFEIETEAFVNKCSIIRNNTPNNFIGNQITGVKQYFDFGKNATLTKIKMNIKASNDDIVVLEIATLDGNIIATAEKAVTTEYTDVAFDLENIVIKEPVSIFAYTKGNNLLSYATYGTPYENPSFSYIFPDGTRKIAYKFGTSEASPTTLDNKNCLVLFFDYTSKSLKNILDSISQNGVHTIFVSTSGSDETGDGTEENPFATIYHANYR